MKRGSQMRYGADSLAAIWGAASTQSLHGAFCTCAGGGALTMSPKQLEEDVLDFLLERYANEEPVAAALRQRIREKAGAFVPWFETLLADPQLSSDTARRLRADVIGVCQSIAAPDNGLICR